MIILAWTLMLIVFGVYMDKALILGLWCLSSSLWAMDPCLSKLYLQRKRELPCEISFMVNIDNKAMRYCVFIKLLYGDKNELSSIDVVDLARNLLKDSQKNKEYVSGIFYLMKNLEKNKKDYLKLNISVMLDSLVFVKRYLAIYE